MKMVIIVGLMVFVLIAAMVAAWCKLAGRESRKEEKEHPCSWCQRWGECNGVDKTCPLIQAYEEARSAVQKHAFFRCNGESKKRGDDND